jgi:DNA helicase-2/ATP-dependent DNA helicase PcrA
MWTGGKEGNPVYVLNARSKEEEAEKVADFIIRLKEENPESFPAAILYRINSQSLAFETEFTKRGIDFKIIKGLRFFDRKEIKDSLALLKLAVNPDDDISFLRIIDFLPVGIGSKTLDSLTAQAKKKTLSLFLTLKEFMPDKFKARDIFAGILSMNRKQENFKRSEILSALLKSSGYLESLETRGKQSRLLNIEELIEFIKKWELDNPDETFSHLMDRISLDSGDSENKEVTQSHVFLLTMHNAKGLEFPTVFVAGVNTSYMPFFMRKGRAELEEERRLFYVAATRAIKQLIISIGAEKPSRFLTEVKRALYSNIFSVEELFDQLAPPIHRTLPERGIGQEIREEKYLDHPLFGRGKIINAIDKDRYVVDFIKKGEKIIDVSVAPVTFL